MSFYISTSSENNVRPRRNAMTLKEIENQQKIINMLLRPRRNAMTLKEIENQQKIINILLRPRRNAEILLFH